MVNFDVQRGLTDMEDRLNARLETIEQKVDTIAAKHAELAGRVKSLEEKAGWIGAGFGALFMGLVGIVWQFLIHS